MAQQMSVELGFTFVLEGSRVTQGTVSKCATHSICPDATWVATNNMDIKKNRKVIITWNGQGPRVGEN